MAEPTVVTAQVPRGIYLRDQIVEIGGHIFQTPVHPQDRSMVKNLGLNDYSELHILSDMVGEGFRPENIHQVPFTIEGGNMIFCEKHNLMIIAVSDLLFDEEDKFLGGSFGDGYFSADEYDEYCDAITSWVDSLGYNVLIIERNLEEYTLDSIYHADTFMACIGDILMIPEAEVLKESSVAELTEVFGEENIIRISKEDWSSLAPNLITLDGNIVFFSKNISPELIEEITKRGYDCVVPPFTTSRITENWNDGLRCATQKLSLKAIENCRIAVEENLHESSEEESQVEDDEISEEERTSSSKRGNDKTSSSPKRLKITPLSLPKLPEDIFSLTHS